MLTTNQVIEKYGNLDLEGDGKLDLGWANENLIVVGILFPMRLSWQPKTTVTRVQCHRLIAPNLVGALSEVATRVAPDELRKRNLDFWGGCFNFRLIRGGKTLSRHAWGIAVDINPQIGRMGSLSDADNYPQFIVEAFRANGSGVACGANDQTPCTLKWNNRRNHGKPDVDATDATFCGSSDHRLDRIREGVRRSSED